MVIVPRNGRLRLGSQRPRRAGVKLPASKGGPRFEENADPIGTRPCHGAKRFRTGAFAETVAGDQDGAPARGPSSRVSPGAFPARRTRVPQSQRLPPKPRSPGSCPHERYQRASKRSAKRRSDAVNSRRIRRLTPARSRSSITAAPRFLDQREYARNRKAPRQVHSFTARHSLETAPT